MSSGAGMREVVNRFVSRYGETERIDGQRLKVCRHLGQCRTPALGGMRLRCDRCADEPLIYYACRDRHCPRCQQRATRRWSEREQASLLPVAYFHLVFTVPHGLNGWVALHPQVLYRCLFEAVWATLSRFAERDRHGPGQLGMSAVLHTWGQTLTRHVHLHCLVPGGTLGVDGHWRSVPGTYLYPVRALSRRFRGAMVARLRQAATAGALHRVSRTGEVDDTLDALMATHWVVYAKPCLTHTVAVVGYLARYTHRIAISDRRIEDVDEQRVRFRYTDYADGNREKTMSLAGTEFVRRFLMHVLPKGFMRVRHYGFLANRCRRAKLARIHQSLNAQALAVEAPDGLTRAKPVGTAPGTLNPGEPDYPCRRCDTGRLRLVAIVAPGCIDTG